ncbi:MAG: PTS sugar transporter subunit IIA [Firmicutes bacterium]|nr:PTS sugar transporter subunit IIA [Candidatus Fermentithermobacillaceae bacterium]
MELLVEKVQGDREQVLSYLADVLLQKGFVKEGYKESLLDRERRFPTGLYVNDELKVAIPHTEIAYANENVLVVAKPLNRLSFYRMDKPGDPIDVDVVFMLVVRDPGAYTKFLSKLTEKLTDGCFVKLIKAGDLDNLSACIREVLLV